MNPGDAASLWNQLMRPLRNSGYTLISPATTSAPNSKDWMRNFLSACGGSCVSHTFFYIIKFMVPQFELFIG